MIMTILYIFTEATLVLTLLLSIFHISLRKSNGRILAFFFSVIALGIITNYLPENYSDFMLGTIAPFAAVIVYKGPSRRRALAYAPLIIFALDIFEISLLDLLMYILRYTVIASFDKVTLNLILNLILILLWGLIKIFHRSKKAPQEELILTRSQYCLALSGEIMSVLLCSFMQYIAECGANNKVIEFLPVISSMFAFLAILFLFACFRQQIATNRSLQLEKEKNEFSLFVKLQSDHYDELIKKNDELRRFRHDYNYHMRVLGSYLHKGQLEDACTYLDSISKSYDASETHLYSGRPFIDSIIDDFKTKAVSEKVSWTFDGRIPNLPVKDCYALCTILSNLIKNAIEACQKVDSNPFVDISVGWLGSYISVTIKNSCSSDSSLSETSKGSRENHGWGLKNVRRTIESNNGVLDISIIDSVCTAEVIYQIR